MNELQVTTLRDRIDALLRKVFNRSYVEQMITTEHFDDEILSLIERVQEIYEAQVGTGSFSVDELQDTLESKDEEVLCEIANIIMSDGEAFEFYRRNTDFQS